MANVGILDDNFKERDTILIQDANLNMFNQEIRPKINTESDNSTGLEFELKENGHLSYSGRSGKSFGHNELNTS